MALADWYRAHFTFWTIYRSSTTVVFLGQPPLTFQTAIPMVSKAFQVREKTLLLIPNSSASLVKQRPSSKE
ncbi:hypothetical protein TNCV_853021 [Trichonephila clavipes]|nr:hypothetical protein TNCV_853021 [Trichonephila clavipes]